MQDANDRPRQAFFETELARIPESYSPIAHLTTTAGIGVAAWAAGYAAVDDFRWSHLAFALGCFVLANLVEWLAHKELLHRRRRFFEPLYDQHTPRHHMFYGESTMAVASRREWKFVLMPRRGVLGIALLAIPLALAFGALLDASYGWAAAMTFGSYASVYEVMHLAYHLRDDHPIRRAPLLGRAVRWLSRHHAKHHDPRLMQAWNFNVTVPLWDFLLGTNRWGRKAQEP